MPKIASNYIGKAMSGFGSVSSRAWASARHGMDTALSNNIARFAVPAAGLGLYALSRNSDNRAVRMGGDIMGLGALGMAGYGAFRGSYGATARSTARSAMANVRMGQRSMNRMASRAGSYFTPVAP